MFTLNRLPGTVNSGVAPGRAYPRLCWQVGAVVDHGVGAERAQLPGHVVAPHDVDRAYPARLGENNDMPADRRVRDILDYAIAGLQGSVIFEQQESRRRIDAQHRGLQKVEPGRDRDDILGANTAGLGPVLAL